MKKNIFVFVLAATVLLQAFPVAGKNQKAAVAATATAEKSDKITALVNKKMAEITSAVLLDAEKTGKVRFASQRYYMDKDSIIAADSAADVDHSVRLRLRRFMNELEAAMGVEAMSSWMAKKAVRAAGVKARNQLSILHVDSATYRQIYEVTYQYVWQAEQVNERYKYDEEVKSQKREELRRQRSESQNL
jgi:hypothetical protein